MTALQLLNRQNVRRLPRARLSASLKSLIRLEPLPHKEVLFVFVSSKEMTQINWQFLKHRGATDVITFQHGEIVICPDFAWNAARDNGETFTRELLRYAIHGWLHLRGYEDHDPVKKAAMWKRQEELVERVMR